MKIGTGLFVVVMLITIAVCVLVLYVLFTPKIANKSGPAWLWRWGRFDPVRNIFFHQDGSLRSASIYILTPIVLLVAAGAAFLLIAALSGGS